MKKYMPGLICEFMEIVETGLCKDIPGLSPDDPDRLHDSSAGTKQNPVKPIQHRENTL